MSKTTTTVDDRRALLTSNIADIDISNTSSKYINKKYCKRILIAFTICLIIGIVAIFIFVIYDVFDLSRCSQRKSIKPGMIGLWPTYGGSLKNQKKPPNTTSVEINKNNVANLKIECVYNSPNGSATTGYPTIDDNKNAYFADLSGYITSINLNSCDVVWRSHIGILLGYDSTMKVLIYQSLTLFQDSNGDKGLLFATPQSRWTRYDSTYSNNLGCYAIAIHIDNGTLFWKIAIGEDNNAYNYQCGSHGFYVDGKYAFGGMTQSALYDADNINSKYIGRYLKIDIDSHEIVNQWYPFNINLTHHDEYNKSYIGVSAYNFPAMIDDYLVFGTANLYQIPQSIDDCLVYGQSANSTQDGFNSFVRINNSHYIDLCGNHMSHNRFWRCLEKNIFVDSLIILNKTNFKMLHGFPLQGLDVFYDDECKFNSSFSKYCPSQGNQGFNSDLSSVATFKNRLNGKLVLMFKNDKYNKKISILCFGVGRDENDSGWIKDLNHSFLNNIIFK